MFHMWVNYGMFYVFQNQYHVARLSPERKQEFYLFTILYRDQSAHFMYAI